MTFNRAGALSLTCIQGFLFVFKTTPPRYLGYEHNGYSFPSQQKHTPLALNSFLSQQKQPLPQSQSNYLNNTTQVWRVLLNKMISSHAKFNHLGYLYVIKYNFVTTERIFKIRNSAESYCLAEPDTFDYNEPWKSIWALRLVARSQHFKVVCSWLPSGSSNLSRCSKTRR